jgi:hypothetical protein
MTKKIFCPKCNKEIPTREFFLLSTLTPISGFSNDIDCPTLRCSQKITIDAKDRMLCSSIQLATIGIIIFTFFSFAGFEEANFITITSSIFVVVFAIYISFKVTALVLPRFVKFK